MKVCSKCKQSLPLEMFHKCKKSKDGLFCQCKICRYKHESTPEAKERRRIAQKKYRDSHIDIVREFDRARGCGRPNTTQEKRREYYRRVDLKARSDPKKRVSMGISRRLRSCLNGDFSKAGRKWETLVGFTTEQLVKHIEKKFKPGMSWDNYGEWHIDHIIPIAAFNFTSSDHPDFKRCWGLNNLQPLWAIDNILKKDKLSKPFQPFLAFKVCM